jgi:serine/threonine protein kinase/tetratricopeptide (TPR) repeat protein
LEQEKQMIGQTISHYKILEKLGEGGMGVVYKAQDTQLDRIVALKFLPQHLTADEAEQLRFLQEAKAASALNHPNVCWIHSIGEHEGQRFIDMEFVDGKTLRSRIAEGAKPPDGQGFRIGEAIDCAIQIGDALREAHSKGIIHRDIKCENIMVNARNQIKVMDFGLAKLKGSLKLTRTSSTVGTLAYMAPEQLQGGEVDARSDIFSFGVVFYEMLTGRMPFRGEHEAAMMYSILNEQPAPLLILRPDIPAELDRIVQRSLEKDPEDRYQHVDDMVSELRRVQKQSTRVVRPQIPQQTPDQPAAQTLKPTSRKKLWIGIAGGLVLAGIAATLLYKTVLAPGSGSVSSRKMLVVLPFENLGSPEQEYFADGITEEITSKLSGLSGLGVIARSSAMQYKKTSKSVKQVGQELGVSYILQGTIRWEDAEGAKHVRVTPQLINVADGTQVWSEPFESVLSGAFKLQTEIAGNVARALDVALMQPERRSLEASPTTNPEAYDNYLRALSYYNRSYDERDLRIAEQLLTKAVQLDPNFASAYASLSVTHSDIYWEYYDHAEERIVKAKEAAEKSLRLDPALALAHVALGMYYYHGRLDYDNALKELDQALALQPNNVEALEGIGAVKRRQGKFEDAAMNFTKAVEIDPRAGSLNAELAVTYMFLRKFPESERYADKAIALTPDWSEPYVHKANTYLRWNGNVAKARAVLEEAATRKVGGQDGHFTYVSGAVDILDGRYQDSLDRLSRFESKALDVQEYFIPVDLLKAQIYGYMKRPKEERMAYESSRVMLDRLAKEHPDDSRIHSSLGIAYAGLGRKDDAIREGRLAVQQLPISREALRGIFRAGDLARIYVMTGEQDAALELLEQLLSVPSLFTASMLRLDPEWETLRGNPRFEKLIAEKK